MNRRAPSWLGVGLGAALAAGGCGGVSPRLFIARPVVDLRAAPQTAAQLGVHDDGEETQLLYGEEVRVLRRRQGWAYVEAVEQPEFSHAGRWQGYPGWVPESAVQETPELMPPPNLIVTAKWAPAWDNGFRAGSPTHRFPMGTKLTGVDFAGRVWKIELGEQEFAWIAAEDARRLDALARLQPPERRRLILDQASKFLGDPYVWGGRSPYGGAAAGGVTGVDCSGLVSLAYRAAGVDVPRDAQEQFLRARRVDAPGVADLIFLSAPDDPGRIVHVMIYAGDGTVLEGPGTGQTVRRIPVADRLGQPVEHLRPGAVVKRQTVFFGAYLP